nr:hypothetical protein [Tanacetum cinerariifolium]
MYTVKNCTRIDAQIRSPTGIGAGLGEHLSPMECPNKIPIGDQDGFGAWFANRVWGWRGGTSNDGFQTIQMKGVRDPLVSEHGTGDNGKPMDYLVDGSRKKAWAPPRKNDEKSILRDLQESDDDADMENDNDETTTLVVSKSLGNSMGENT